MKGPGDMLIIALNRPRKGRQAPTPPLSLTAPLPAGKRGNRMVGPHKMRATGRDRMRRGKRVRAVGRFLFTPLSLTVLIRAGKTSGIA